MPESFQSFCKLCLPLLKFLATPLSIAETIFDAIVFLIDTSSTKEAKTNYKMNNSSLKFMLIKFHYVIVHTVSGLQKIGEYIA